MDHLQRWECTDQVSRNFCNGIDYEDIRIGNAANILFERQAHGHAGDVQ